MCIRDRINDNHGVVDAIGASTGDTVTIFQENIRVATNVMQNGKRAVEMCIRDSKKKSARHRLRRKYRHMDPRGSHGQPGNHHQQQDGPAAAAAIPYSPFLGVQRSTGEPPGQWD